MRQPSPLLKGTLDVLVLKTLSWEPMHGYNIIHWIRQQTGGGLDVDDAALYQSLHRLEGRGLLRSEWGVSENNRRAKYYELTKRGRAELAAEAKRWQSFAASVLSVLQARSL